MLSVQQGAFIDQHFDHDLNFYATEEDNVSGKVKNQSLCFLWHFAVWDQLTMSNMLYFSFQMMKRMIVNVKPKDFGSIIKGYPGEDPKMLAHFRDLLDKIFILDPEKRLTVKQALAHPFITSKWNYVAVFSSLLYQEMLSSSVHYTS